MRRYNSIAEIVSEESFRPRNAVNQHNYRKLKGPYALVNDEELECCCQKPNWNLCERRHRMGWVAELQDGTSTVLGGNCAKDKYGAESPIGRDIAIATNEIARQDEVLRLSDLLRERDGKLAELEEGKRQLVAIERAVQKYFDDLGRSASKTLTEMSRTGRAALRVLGIVPGEYNSDGELVRDRKVTPIDVGTIAGVAVCNLPRIKATLTDLRSIEQAYKLAGSDPERPFKRKDLKALNAALADQARVMAAIEDWKQQFDRFEANDFTVLAFAVADLSERIRVTQFGLRRAGDNHTRESAKRLIQNREAAMKVAHGVKQIRVQ